MKTVNERNLEATRVKRDEIRQKSREILEAQAEESRSLSEDETKQLAQFVSDMKTLDDEEKKYADAVKVEQEVLQIGQDIGAREPNPTEGIKGIQDVSVTREVKSLGQIFVESPQFKAIQENGISGQFTTGAIEIDTKGTLLSGTGAPGTGTGGGLLMGPQNIPGVVDKLFQRLTVADLLASGSTNTNTLRYVVEGTATSGAAGVAEGGTKPESTLALSTVDEPVKKIATVLHVSDEMLEDAAQVESYINNRLGLFCRIEEERQIVHGAGTNELVGITGRSGVNTYAGGTVDSNAVVLFKALNGTRGSSFLEPDAIIMNPTDWQVTRLETDSNGQFYGGGPFTGAYGNGPIPGQINSGQLTGGTDAIWNKPVLVTTAIGAGTALLGAFAAAAQLFRRSGLTVEATNAHDQHFVKNLVAIRAEQRLGLAVYRPTAFTKVLFQ